MTACIIVIGMIASLTFGTLFATMAAVNVFFQIVVVVIVFVGVGFV